MHSYEFIEAKRRLVSQQALVQALRPNALVFKKEFRKYLCLLIAAKGHAWCMDVKEERNKMSKLITGAVEEIFECK